MFEKPQSTHVLGLDIDAFSLKGATIHQTRNGLHIENFFDFPVEFIQEEGDVKPLYTQEQQALLQATSDNTLIVTSVNTQDILVRPLELKLTKDKDIDAALIFQAEPLLPYPIENAVIDKVVLSKEKESSQLAVFAIRKDHLSQHLKQWNALDIEPEVISASPLGLVLFGNHFFPHSEPYFIVHLGIENSCAVLIDQNKLVTTQAIPASLYPLIELLMKKGINKPAAYSELLQKPLESNTFPEIKQALDTIRMSVTRTLFSLAKQLKGKEVKEMVITGPGSSVGELCQLLGSTLNKTILTPTVHQKFGATDRELLLYALPIGEALSALPKCKEQINFRQNDFAYPEPWKRLKQPVSFYVLLCCGVALALFLFGKSYVSYKEGEMRQQYLNLLQVMNKPYKEVEREFTHKYDPSNTSEIVPDIASLDEEEIKKRLNFLESEIQSTPQTFPLQPNVPLVTDVLAWISSHPNFIDKASAEFNDTPPQAMRVESLSYNMVKRPDPTKKQDRYQVKVELEFSSPVPKMAREFHDALIAPNDMVDPKGEIKWNSNKDRYRTSFYLKDKTVYPGL